MKKILKIGSIMIALAFMLSPAAAEKASGGNNLNMALFWLDENIEPIQGWNGWTLTRCGVGENLVQLDENLRFKPVIAESWEQTDPFTTVFQIRKGVLFHNGQPADANACKVSILRAHNNTDRKDMQFQLDTITADGDTLTIKTKEPYAILLNVLADPVYIIVDAAAAEKDPDSFKFKPIATGAFKVKTFSADTGLTLEKHSKHWNGVPQVDTVNVKYIPEAYTRTVALQSGELDLATQLNPRDLQLFEGNKKFTVHKGPNIRIFLARINFDKPHMKNSAFRQALMHGIDKDTYATKLAGGFPARGPFNELLPFGYKGEEYYPYNPEKATELLDDAGFIDSDGDGIREVDGKNLVLKYVCSTNAGKSGIDIGTAMQAQYKAIGIALEIAQVENAEEIIQQGDYDFKLDRWTSAPTADPQYFLEASFKTGALGNQGHYSNPTFDALCEKLASTMDREERNKLGVEGTKILLEDTAAIFLYYGMGNIVTGKRVGGIHRFISEVYYIDERVTLE